MKSWWQEALAQFALAQLWSSQLSASISAGPLRNFIRTQDGKPRVSKLTLSTWSRRKLQQTLGCLGHNLHVNRMHLSLTKKCAQSQSLSSEPEYVRDVCLKLSK